MVTVRNVLIVTALVAGASLLDASRGWAQEQDTTTTQDTTPVRPSLAGPDQVDNQLETDAQPKQPLFKLLQQTRIGILRFRLRADYHQSRQ